MNLKVKILILVIFMISCNEEIIEKPSNLISEDEMVNILYDIAVVKAYDSYNASANQKEKILDFPNDYVFKKHQIDSVQLSHSNIYYASKPEQHIRIFTKVFDRINSEKELLVKSKDSLSTEKRVVTSKKNNLKKVDESIVSGDEEDNIIYLYNSINDKFWRKINSKVIKINSDKENESFLIKRMGVNKSSYISSKYIEIPDTGIYRYEILVQKADSSNLFGMRIMTKYPDRCDVLFNLNSGEVIGSNCIKLDSARYQMEKVENNWYKCSIELALTDDMKVILVFGSSSKKDKIASWVAKSNELTNVIVMNPSFTMIKDSLDLH